MLNPKKLPTVSPLHLSAVLVLHSSISPAEGTSHPGTEHGSAMDICLEYTLTPSAQTQ